MFINLIGDSQLEKGTSVEAAAVATTTIRRSIVTTCYVRRHQIVFIITAASASTFTIATTCTFSFFTDMTSSTDTTRSSATNLSSTTLASSCNGEAAKLKFFKKTLSEKGMLQKQRMEMRVMRERHQRGMYFLGIAIPSGLFIPVILAGASYGRIIGQILSPIANLDCDPLIFDPLSVEYVTVKQNQTQILYWIVGCLISVHEHNTSGCGSPPINVSPQNYVLQYKPRNRGRRDRYREDDEGRGILGLL
ncbi:hypothetical protein L2E82_32374 [Cichorium intybus]|uniref:Uncharacterized protein n=1 Tax=Cichorium intybus TaxID=13427 RepID=A0ACB9BFS2_CICIN|nr:hypothetical protein L2E82_32374 [Cichorium intybus]